MKAAARLQAIIDLLDRIAEPVADKARTPADAVVSGYVRGRRYIGSGDRRAITDTVFGILRDQPLLDWLLGGAASGPRGWALANLIWRLRLPFAEIDALFDGSQYGPAPLTGDERAAVSIVEERIAGLDEAPPWVRGRYPEWLDGEMARAFGEARAEEGAALACPAPVDLRVNALKADREKALGALRAHGFEAEPTPLSPHGIRLAGRGNLSGAQAFKDGWIEPQDEAAQIVVLLAGAAPGMVVLDYCAGAGGKALALAAQMEGRGTLIAHDLTHARLKPLIHRAERAGADGLIRLFAAADDAALSADAFDIVLVDAPCSGTGTWRRQPEGRLRLTEAELTGYIEQQREILEKAARHVRPGGRLVYATCSLLPCENEDRIAGFLDANPDFVAADMAALWRDILPGEPPLAASGAILLTPHRCGTDGFFCAVLERRTR